MIKHPVKLPILHLTDENQHLESLGIDVPTEDCDPVEMTFFDISAIGPSTYDGCSIIYIPGMTFVCPLLPEKAVKMVLDQNQLRSGSADKNDPPW